MTTPARLALLATLLLPIAFPALAGGPERVAPVSHAATAKECGECHMAYQPGLLPAAAWERVMATLPDHFGDDATLPADTVAAIRDYLVRNAGGGDPAVSRISAQPWWLREHDPRWAAWTRPGAPPRSDCQACHPGAARGDYEGD